MVASCGREVTRVLDVLVVGAGPTGLTTALQAQACGATVRVVERRPEAWRASRAMIVHSRALESLRPLGVTDGLLDRADPSPRAELHLGRRRIGALLADVAIPDTAFPHLTMVRQMDLEEVLTEVLQQRGVDVERGVELVDASTDAGAAHATLRSAGRVEETTCRFVAGCDGRASTVRGAAGIAWKGGSYRQEVVLADAELDGDLRPGVLHVAAGRAGLVFLFSPGERATWRVLATRPAGRGDWPSGPAGLEVPASDIQEILDLSGMAATLTQLRWSSQVRLQHRLAQHFRQGRLFLAGDAAHTHSPAAAQGMNTGILDAVNLGWKLAFASDDAPHTVLLDSYEPERRPVARRVLALTHVVFFAEASTSAVPSFVRGAMLPLLAPAIPAILRQQLPLAQVVRLLSQRWVRYRRSTLSVEGSPGGPPGPRPGDRLPDQEVTCDGRRSRLHELTARPGVHILLAREAHTLDQAQLGRQVSQHRISSWPGRGLMAVRPDGYVGFRSGDPRPGELGNWLDLVGAR
jgi:2-polyprenyl-6-methoxyphenol hydroxylase-like FAD-dependent oxidoreductase